jgi:hypothetical protein
MNLFGRLPKNPDGILAYSKGFLGNMTDKGMVQMSGRGF